ncbi:MULTISPECIES: hypothetical protein [unclassified Empedobacter]|uniref:hypothetical protein n=1 Tax=unclassified Empedobacter TaxID=2643773 RepID=UPI0025BB4C0E|nr:MULTISPECIES: hypothetical protein [unclassified Empedobacter]
MSKNIFLKDKDYKITINENQQKYSLNTKSNKIEIELDNCQNNIEISSKNFRKTHKISHSENDVIFLNIYPKLSYDLALGILIGFSIITAIIIGILSFKNGVNLSLIFISFLPLFFLKRNNFKDGFEIKEIKQ